MLFAGVAFATPNGVAAATLDDAVAFYKQGAFADAAPILEHLADAGDPTANFWLGSMWHQGRGKPVNYRTAHGL
jgi:TPR repeat protein